VAKVEALQQAEQLRYQLGRAVAELYSERERKNGGQSVEVVGRRVGCHKIQAGPHDARIAAGWQPRGTAHDAPVSERGPLLPADVPTLGEMDSVSDIS
jgi:hypothetical protein